MEEGVLRGASESSSYWFLNSIRQLCKAFVWLQLIYFCLLGCHLVALSTQWSGVTHLCFINLFKTQGPLHFKTCSFKNSLSQN